MALRWGFKSEANSIAREIRAELSLSSTAAVAFLRCFGHRAGGDLMPYRCSNCGGWHVGHPPRAVRESMEGL